MTITPWESQVGKGCIVATAIHDGNALRPEVREIMKLSEAARLREEDPFTGDWARLFPTYVIATQSRFEMDLNRPLDEAVYITPDDAWGLDIWRQRPSDELIERSRAEHRAFYQQLGEVYGEKARQHDKFVVFDLHAYNHRRDGPDGAEADPTGNPVVNIGTGTMDRSKWASLIDRFIEDLGAQSCLGRRLDVRENVKFVGRRHGEWAHTTFPDAVCVLSVEFKKIFMDEWTGQLNSVAHAEIGQALRATIPGLEQSLKALGARLS